ncbi:cytidylate kinase [Bacteroidia bacterium]|nr:cytidylate kinase [Bacteroidia bacterium]
MKKRVIITIGRQFGSGGRVIGQRLAKDLGIACYDKELLAEAAKESGISDEFFEKADERANSGLTYLFPIGFPSMGFYTPHSEILSPESLFLFQSEAIKSIVDKGDSCVLVGRCADFVLRDYPDLLSFFIHNTPENRIQTIVERQQISKEAALDLMKKTDKSRAAYYKYYTDKEWGMSSSYHFSINVSLLGLEATVELIKRIIEERIEKEFIIE